MITAHCSASPVLLSFAPLFRRVLPAALTGLALVTALLPVTLSAQVVTSSVPTMISFQGKVRTTTGLVGEGTPVNRTVILRLWSSASGSTSNDLIYSEQQIATIAEGEFSVLLGQGTAVAGSPLGYAESTKGPGTVSLGDLSTFSGATRYLGITVDDGTAAADAEISPRQQIVTSAYAFRAKYAESLGTNGATSLAVVDGGNVGIGFPNPGFKLEVNGNVSAAGSIAATGASGHTFRTGDLDGGLFSPADDNVVLKTNGADRLTVTSASVTVNSPKLFAPAYGFTSGDTDGEISSPADGVIGFRTNATERMRVDSNGRLGLGTTTPTFTVDVRSTAPEILVGTTGNLLGALYFGTNGHGIKRNYNGVANDVGVFTTSGDLYLSANGATRTTDFLLKNSTGSVAIGTATVTDRLNVGGNVRVTGVANPSLILADAANATRGTLAVATSAGSFGTDTAASDTILRSESGKILLQSGSGASALAISAGNLVGIGTAAPAAKLDIGGNTNDSIQAILTRGADTNFRLVAQNKSSGSTTGSEVSRLGLAYGSTFYTGFAFIRGGTSNDSSMAVLTAGTERMRFASDGNVGIGTSTTTNARLNVSPSDTGRSVTGAWLGSGGAHTSDAHSARGYSIYTSAGIWASDLVVVSSDARTKAVVGRSDAAQDLATLQKIEVTDYTYIDTVAKGTARFKKVIAQQVEQVFPLAVRQQTEVVPDIYQKATIRDGWVALATDLKPGERVKLVTHKQEGIYEVREVAAGKFRTDFVADGEMVFVYGREVKDFRAVDYEAIAMLNVSATQQIKRDTDAEVSSLRTENAKLRARLAEVETANATRDTRLAAIEKMLSTASTVMARPATSSTASGQ